MPLDNAGIAERLEHLADLLEIQGANPFRVRAYRNAARTVLSVGQPVAELVGEELDELPFVGADLAGKIVEIAQTGDTGLIRELEAQTPGELPAMLSLPGLGPKRVQRLHDDLGVETLDDLERAAQQGEIAALRGFGEAIQRAVLDGLAEIRAAGAARRIGWEDADQVARALVERLGEVAGVGRVVVAGSYRRLRETVGDLDVLATSEDPEPVMERLVTWDRVARVTAHGGTRAAVRLRDGLTVDLRVVPPESEGAALHYFTGSKAHNIAVRRRGVARGLKINEYGVFRGAERIGGATEAEVFAAVELPWIPPELREDRGELEAAETGRLPRLVGADDVRGDAWVRAGADATPDRLRAVVEAARDRGLDFVVLADPAGKRAREGVLGPAGLRDRLAAIAALDVPGITVLAGAEVAIDGRGGLDLPPELLDRLQVVIGAVASPSAHTGARIVRALTKCRVHVLAVPGGLEIEPIARAAVATGCALALDGAGRSRLDETSARYARDLGARFALGSGADAPAGLARIERAVRVARRAWLTAGDVVNTGLSALSLPSSD